MFAATELRNGGSRITHVFFIHPPRRRAEAKLFMWHVCMFRVAEAPIGRLSVPPLVLRLRVCANGRRLLSSANLFFFRNTAQHTHMKKGSTGNNATGQKAEAGAKEWQTSRLGSTSHIYVPVEESFHLQKPKNKS